MQHKQILKELRIRVNGVCSDELGDAKKEYTRVRAWFSRQRKQDSECYSQIHNADDLIICYMARKDIYRARRQQKKSQQKSQKRIVREQRAVIVDDEQVAHEDVQVLVEPHYDEVVDAIDSIDFPDEIQFETYEPRFIARNSNSQPPTDTSFPTSISQPSDLIQKPSSIKFQMDLLRDDDVECSTDMSWFLQKLQQSQQEQQPIDDPLPESQPQQPQPEEQDDDRDRTVPRGCKVFYSKRDRDQYISEHKDTQFHFFQQFYKLSRDGRDMMRLLICPYDRVQEVIKHDYHLADWHDNDTAFMHLDIEKKVSENFSLEQEQMTLASIEELADRWLNVFGCRYTHPSFDILSCHRKNKISYHVHFPKIIVKNFSTMVHIIDDMKKCYNDQATQCMDRCVYRNGCMRNEGQSKQDGVPMKFEVRSSCQFPTRTGVHQQDLDDRGNLVVDANIMFGHLVPECEKRIASRTVPKDVAAIKWEDLSQEEINKFNSAWEQTDDMYIASVRQNYTISKVCRAETSIFFYLRNGGSGKHTCVCGDRHQSNNYHGYVNEQGLIIIQCLKNKEMKYIAQFYENTNKNQGGIKDMGIEYVELNQQYLSTEAIDLYREDKHIFFIKSDTGTGKSVLSETLSQRPQRILMLSSRVMMKTSLCERLRHLDGRAMSLYEYDEHPDIFNKEYKDVKFYQEGDEIPDSKFEQIEMLGASGEENFIFFCQTNSVHRIRDISIYDWIVIDESVSVQHLLLDCVQSLIKLSRIHRKNASQKITKVLIMDALLDRCCIQFYQELFAIREYDESEMIIYNNKYVQKQNINVCLCNVSSNADIPKKSHQLHLDSEESIKRAFFDDDDDKKGKKKKKDQDLHPSKQSLLQALFSSLRSQNKIIKFTASFDSETEMLCFKQFIKFIGYDESDIICFHGSQHMKEKVDNMKRLNDVCKYKQCVLYTQSITVGCSLELDEYTHHFSLITSKTSRVWEQYQQLRRSRKCTDIYIIIDYVSRCPPHIMPHMYASNRFYSHMYSNLARISYGHEKIDLISTLKNPKCIDWTQHKKHLSFSIVDVTREIASSLKDHREQLDNMKTHRLPVFQQLVHDYNVCLDKGLISEDDNQKDDEDGDDDEDGNKQIPLDKELSKKQSNMLYSFQSKRRDDQTIHAHLYMSNIDKAKEYVEKNDISRIEMISDFSIRTYMQSKYKHFLHIHNAYNALLRHLTRHAKDTWKIEVSHPVFQDKSMWSRKNVHEQIEAMLGWMSPSLVEYSGMRRETLADRRRAMVHLFEIKQKLMG